MISKVARIPLLSLLSFLSVGVVGCVTTDTERMIFCRDMCEVTGVQRFQPLTGECRCNKPFPEVITDYVKKE